MAENEALLLLTTLFEVGFLLSSQFSLPFSSLFLEQKAHDKACRHI